MVTREMLEERNAELHAELAEYERACQMVRGALWENQNVLVALNEMEEEDGISHNEVVPQSEGYCAPEVREPSPETPYEEDEAWSEEVVAPSDEEHYDYYKDRDAVGDWPEEVEDGS